jgi:PHD/YefM family antitoxin component YafN of YafNO toxin-antitoxin module
MTALTDTYRKIVTSRRKPECVFVSEQEYRSICDELNALRITKDRSGLAVRTEPYLTGILIANVPVKVK